MVKLCLLPFFFTALLTGWAALAQEAAESGAVSGIREPRHSGRKKCKKYGICQETGGQGGYGGYQQGHQGGYGGYPPINIGISQSQSSANAAGGGYSTGYYPSNYQYNHGGGYGGYPQRPGYFGNGQGAYNNQFNGNYYGGNSNGFGYPNRGGSSNGFGYPNGGGSSNGFGYPNGGGNSNGFGYPNGGGFGGYGFQGPNGNSFYDEGENVNNNVEHEDSEYNRPEHDQGHNNQGPSSYDQDQGSFAAAGSFAYAGRKNS